MGLENLQIWVIILIVLAVFIVAGGIMVLYRSLREKKVSVATDGLKVDGTTRDLQFDFLDRLAVSGPCRVLVSCNASTPGCRCHAQLPPEVKLNHYDGRLEIDVPKSLTTSEIFLEVFCSTMPGTLKIRQGAQLELHKAAGKELNCKVEKKARADIAAGLIQELNLKIGGGSSVHCEAAAIAKAKIHVIDHSKLRLDSSVSELQLHLSDNSNVEVRLAKNAEVDLSGASRLELTVTDKLAGDVSGGSKLSYTGQPVTDLRKSGSSKVKVK